MAEETFFLVLLTIVMLIGSFLAGSIPLIMKLSEAKLKLITVFGAGLLVGTALAVIIPEGIKSIYMDSSAVDSGSEISNKNHIKGNSIQIDHSKIIGFSLVLGFVFMMLVDQISQSRKSNEKNITATLGLVVHAAADGVALGAAATTSHQDVEVIVFLAIMLHKAPAAFGLVSFLLHEKMERQEIRKHLAFFCLSAPAFSLLTYFGIGKEQKDTLNSMNATGIAMLFSAGTFLYVATVHVLPELTQISQDHSHTISNQYEYKILEDAEELISDSSQKQKHFASKGLKLSELVIMSIGAFLPLIITFSHHH